jgi:UDP-N-acetylmuramate--alanine ligase
MKKIYFIGINGIGMSGLAKIMKNKGYEVAGTDLSRTYVTEELESLNIKVNSKHEAENIIGFDLVVISSAIKESNPEYKYALDNGIKIIKRGELLAMLLNKEVGIAIAGTHGKTTTSSMLGATMLSVDPTLVIGGILPEIGSNSKIGKSEYFIAEADESDKSFLYMHPKYSVVTNIEKDHMENYGSLDSIKDAFNNFMNQTTIEIIACIDCPITSEVIKDRQNIKTYSLKNKSADIYAYDIKIQDGKTYYKVRIQERELGEFHLSIPGEHNILNSLPVIYLADKFDVEIKLIREALANFKGAKRRYDILLDNKIKLIDDYAHHPTEIKATLKGAHSIENRPITAIFQPHRYSRINFLLNEFKDAFKDTDELLLMPIYSAGEINEYGITEEKLLNTIGHKNGKIVKDFYEIENRILNEHKGRVFLFMGAGNISYAAHEIADKYRGERQK